ncbi:MAG TPA: hypothetical protein VGO47_13820, partial [Chlamydiales bacterium]|nr:hypothetical protein [Chlamydiales bacterium]
MEIIKPHCNGIESTSLEGLLHTDIADIPEASVLVGANNTVDLVVLFGTLPFSSSAQEILLQTIVQQCPCAATIVLIHGAPDSEFVTLMNDAFTSPEMLKYGKSQVHHEGVLLKISEKVLKHAGFTNQAFHPLSRLSLKFDHNVPSDGGGGSSNAAVDHVSALLASMYHWEDDANHDGSSSSLEIVLKAQLQPLL